MFDLSERLKLVATNLEPFTETGGVVSGAQARWLWDQLQLCTVSARKLQFDLSWAERLLDEVVGDAREQAVANAPPPVRRATRLRVIVGGRAQA